MTSTLTDQARRFYHVFADLVRAYQFRDREETCCHGLSVSQCYTLDTLERHGALSMGELAGHLYLEISSMTRVVDQLVARKLVARITDAADRRVCRVQIARKGRALIAQVRADIVKEHERVLREVSAEGREAVITVLSRLREAFDQRQACAADRQAPNRRDRRRAS